MAVNICHNIYIFRLSPPPEILGFTIKMCVQLSCITYVMSGKYVVAVFSVLLILQNLKLEQNTH